jgi:hypothetical protein
MNLPSPYLTRVCCCEAVPVEAGDDALELEVNLKTHVGQHLRCAASKKQETLP